MSIMSAYNFVAILLIRSRPRRDVKFGDAPGCLALPLKQLSASPIRTVLLFLPGTYAIYDAKLVRFKPDKYLKLVTVLRYWNPAVMAALTDIKTRSADILRKDC